MDEVRKLYPPHDELADDDDQLEGCTCAATEGHGLHVDHVHDHYPVVAADDELEGFLVPEGGG